MAKKADNSFEKNLQALEKLVNKLETGDLSLEASLKEFEQGIQLARSCQVALREAEQKVQILTGKGDSASAQPFSEIESNTDE